MHGPSPSNFGEDRPPVLPRMVSARYYTRGMGDLVITGLPHTRPDHNYGAILTMVQYLDGAMQTVADSKSNLDLLLLSMQIIDANDARLLPVKQPRNTNVAALRFKLFVFLI